jgi:hypothetical protein
MKTLGKKADHSIPIVILVLMTLVLTSSSLFIFYVHSGKVSATIMDSRILDDVYSKENKINFYLNDIFDKSVLKIGNRENPVPEFIASFKEELVKYKQNNSYIMKEFEQIESQVNEQNILFDNQNLSINFNIKIDRSFADKFVISYDYNKKFIRKLN